MEHNPLFDRLWGADGSHPFGDPYKFDEYMNDKYEDLETEVCEFIKGDFKTTIVCKFNKKGYMVTHSTYCENIGESKAILANLKDDLLKALEEERYEDIGAIQEQINKYREIVGTIGKPTL